MKPWDIIGWIILGFSGLVFGGLVFGLWLPKLVLWTARGALYRKTRNDPPKAGDRWVEGGVLDRGIELRITNIHPNGMIGIETTLPGRSKLSWGELPEKWNERVRQRKLWRSRP